MLIMLTLPSFNKVMNGMRLYLERYIIPCINISLAIAAES